MSLKPITIKVNPRYASAVSQMTSRAYDQLKKSIAEEGLHYTIVVNQDYVLLDGHHRFRACQELGRPITEVDIEVKHFDDPLEEKKFVHIINLIRRHLTPYQEAEEISKIEEIEAEEATRRQMTGKKIPLSSNELKVDTNTDKGQARDIAIKKYGSRISPTTYTRAKKIMNSPEVTEEQKKKLRDPINPCRVNSRNCKV